MSKDLEEKVKEEKLTYLKIVTNEVSALMDSFRYDRKYHTNFFPTYVGCYETNSKTN